MPKGSEALTRARREEIIDACAALYKTMSLREITIKLIGARTSFTRTSIYNYFETKEEIFLALLQREYAAWTDDLNALPAQPGADALADALAGTLARRGTMLRLLSMNLYDIEANSRVENGLRRLDAGGAQSAGAQPARYRGGRLRAVSLCAVSVFVRHIPLHRRHPQTAAGDGAGRGQLPAVIGV